MGSTVDEEKEDVATGGAGGGGGKGKAGTPEEWAADEEEVEDDVGAAGRLDATTCAASCAVVGSRGGRRSLHCEQRSVGQDLDRQCQLA